MLTKLSEDQILAMGDFCEALRLSPNWQRLVNTFEENAFEAFTITQPKEVKEREGIYNRYNGVQDFFQQMNAFISAAKKIRDDNDQPKLSEFDPLPAEDDDA